MNMFQGFFFPPSRSSEDDVRDLPGSSQLGFRNWDDDGPGTCMEDPPQKCLNFRERIRFLAIFGRFFACGETFGIFHVDEIYYPKLNGGPKAMVSKFGISFSLRMSFFHVMAYLSILCGRSKLDFAPVTSNYCTWCCMEFDRDHSCTGICSGNSNVSWLSPLSLNDEMIQIWHTIYIFEVAVGSQLVCHFGTTHLETILSIYSNHGVRVNIFEPTMIRG